jgi:hypothetical protein
MLLNYSMHYLQHFIIREDAAKWGSSTKPMHRSSMYSLRGNLLWFLGINYYRRVDGECRLEYVPVLEMRCATLKPHFIPDPLTWSISELRYIWHFRLNYRGYSTHTLSPDDSYLDAIQGLYQGLRELHNHPILKTLPYEEFRPFYTLLREHLGSLHAV